MINFIKKYKKTIFYFLMIFSSTSFLLSIYNHKIMKDNLKVDPGFMKSTSFENDGILCNGGSKDNSCIEKIFKDFKLSKRNILFLGNSQTGAVNNYNEEDKSYVSLLNKEFSYLNNEIKIKGIWFPNANIIEFERINFLLDKCSIDVEMLIIPVFLDDTRNELIRNEINRYKKNKCFFTDVPLKENTIKNSNLFITNKFLKEKIGIFNFLDKLNKNFRLDIYKFRNLIFGIKPDSIRNIRSASYKSNIKALRDIVKNRNYNNKKTIIYIPPLLHFESKKTIPYDNKEYSKLKNDLKELCKKNACNFFNLETIVPDKLWGLKSSTSLLRDKKEIDFMHFKYGGHEIMSKKFLEILTNFYTF